MPILGINLGKVGFLSKAEADGARAGARAARRGRVRTSRERMAPHRVDPPGRAAPTETTVHRAQRHRGRPRLAGPRRPAGRDDRRDPPRDVRRRRAGRVQPHRLDRLLVLGRRPDPRPAQPQPRRDADRRLPVRDPLDRRVAAARSSAAGWSTRTRRWSRSTAARTTGSQVGDVVEVRALERPIRFVEPHGRAAVLGPAADEGPAAAVVTTPETGSGDAGRLLELAVTDLALIDRLRLPLARRPQRADRRDRRRQEPADRRARARDRRPRRHDARPPRRRDARGSRRCSTASRSR